MAAVDEGRRRFGTEDIRRASQQGYMCLTSVSGMVTSPSAAGGGCSEGAVRAAVGSCERRPVADKDAGHRNRKQVDSLQVPIS